jgi:hypothetical protein
MALTAVDICNLALAQLGGKFTITSLDDETAGARLCKANYASLRDTVLEEMDWSFAKTQHALAADTTASLIEGATKFKIPATTLRVLAVYDGNGVKLDDWSLEQRSVLAFTDALVIRAIDRVEDTTMYSQAFTQALAGRMAAEMAMPLTNSAAMSTTMWQLYSQKISLARTNDGLQGSSQSLPAGRIIKARQGYK